MGQVYSGIYCVENQIIWLPIKKLPMSYHVNCVRVYMCNIIGESHNKFHGNGERVI